MSFEMASSNNDFNFKRISFNPFEFPDGKIFPDDRDLYLNHFDGTTFKIRKPHI